MKRLALCTSLILALPLVCSAEDWIIPDGSKVTVHWKALMQKLRSKQVPIAFVDDESDADYVINASSEHHEGTTELDLGQKMASHRKVKRHMIYSASVEVVRRSSGETVFTDKVTNNHTTVGAASTLADHLAKIIQKDR